MIPICTCQPTTASQDFTARLFAALDVIEAHPAMVRALEETRRLQAITDAAIAFAGRA